MSELDGFRQRQVERAREQLAALKSLDTGTTNPWEMLGRLEVTLEGVLEVIDHLSGSESP